MDERPRAALLLSLETGLRVSDVLWLSFGQVMRGQSLCEKKTGKETSIECPDSLRTTIERWFVQGGEDCDRLVFESRRKKGVPIHRSTLWRQLRRAAENADRHVTPHTARKIFAVETFRRSGSLQKVKEALRHDREDTTALYAFSDRL